MEYKLLLASFALAPFLAMSGCADKGTHRADDTAVATIQSKTTEKQAPMSEATETKNLSTPDNSSAKLAQTKASPPSAPVIVNNDNQSFATTQTTTADSVAENSKRDELFPTIDISEHQTAKPQTLVFQFKFNKHELSNESKAILMQHAEYLSKHKDMVLKVIGHTDSHGPKVYNEFLSRERALSVANMLIEYGANPGQIQVIGKGDAEPLNDVANYAENRRVELDYLNLKSADAGDAEVNLTSSR